MALVIGTTLENRYRIEELLGQGGMGAVYRAYDTRLQQAVAIKENTMAVPGISLEVVEASRRQFEREALMLARLRHPNLPRVIDHFVTPEGNQYLVMDFIEGDDLAHIIARGGPLPEAQAIAWISQACSALEYLHTQDPPIIHRDIKPQNIKVTPKGQVFLVDFGIAKIGEVSKTMTGALGVTPGFSPPEQYAMTGTDARSDIYALGATLYALLTAQTPPESVVREFGEKQLVPPRQLNNTVSPAVQQAVFKAMETRPTNRPQSVVEFRRMLERPEGARKLFGSAPPTQLRGTAAADVRADKRIPAASPPGPAPSPIVPPRSAVPPAYAESRRAKHDPLPLLLAGVGIVAIVLVVLIVVATSNSKGAGILALMPAPTMTAEPTKSPVASSTPVPATNAIEPTKFSEPTHVPVAQPSAIAPGAGAPASQKVKIGLVTDVGGVNDKSFNQSAWAGAQKGATEFGLDVKFIESKQPTDYEKNIDQFATEGYQYIIAAGFLMGDATAIKAKQYPNIKFAIIDNAYFPTKGVAYCDDTKKDCYDDGGLKNVTSLMFQEDQVGYLAGVLAAGMSKTGTVCTVSGMEIPPVQRFVIGFQNGAKWMKADTKTLNVYIPSFTDPAKGKETGQSMIGQGCDVVFGVGGNTGNGGLLAAKEKGLMAIGVDVDQYDTYPEVRDALLSSAAKNADAAVYNYLKSIKDGSVEAGIMTADLSNGGVGLAPYHDWDSKIPQAVKDKVKEAADNLKSGNLATGYK